MVTIKRMYKGKYSGVSIWFSPEDHEIRGYNKLCDFILDIVEPIDHLLIFIASFFGVEPAFEIKYDEEIYKDFEIEAL